MFLVIQLVIIFFMYLIAKNEALPQVKNETLPLIKNEALPQVKNKTLPPEKNLPKSSLISES